MKKGGFFVFIVSVLFSTVPVAGQVLLDPGWHHLRNTGTKEWLEFPDDAGNKKHTLQFSAGENPAEQTLALRQYDVKLNWVVMLNGQRLGSLVADEKDLISCFRIPAGLLQPQNTLDISCADPKTDDIRVGEIVLHPMPASRLLSQAYVDLEVTDAETGKNIPAKITVVNGKGILQSLSAAGDDRVAVRPGYVYTGSGKTLLGLPAGTYTLYAGRGFEYGIDSARMILSAGDHVNAKLNIKREVSTTGWAASDTHIHTYTWSRHGDASAAERVLTIAGEGLELPIMTDHNIHVDLKPFAVDQDVNSYFTPVMGNEVTTGVGHFNVFPVTATKVTSHHADSWKILTRNFDDVEDSRAIVLNHARDIHVGFRPFDRKKHLSVAGMRLDDQDFPANAMEIINSGSQQTDQMELTRDWFGMLNHGYFITPAGSSDSHDVSRYIVGQARTYIRCDDDDPGNIDVGIAVKNFLEGNVMVSFGLLTEIEVNGSYGPGELVPSAEEMKVSVKVSGPSWTRADRVLLYANGKKIREEKITDGNAGGVKWSGSWDLTIPSHDVFLVAAAFGPDPIAPHWPIAKPYQPITPAWTGGIMGISGAVWFDADGNGKRNAAVHYAEELLNQASGNIDRLIRSLSYYDEAVAIQAAALLHQQGEILTGSRVSQALRKASPETKAGFQRVIRELQL